MRMTSNAHTHCTWCDGADSAEDMIQAALALGFDSLGFSCHSPGECLHDEQGYKADIMELKNKYSDRISIFCALEQDVSIHPRYTGYEYIIGSCHHLPKQDGAGYLDIMNGNLIADIIDQEFGGDGFAMAKAYYKYEANAMCRLRPDIVGHFDIIARHNKRLGFLDEENPQYKEAALEAFDYVLDTIGEYGGMFEVNTSAFGCGERDVPYPAPFLLRHAAQRGARPIITTDCHFIKGLDAKFTETLQMLLEAGFKDMAVLTNRGFCNVNI
ncbi:hypothetical protein AGMMS49992_29180 [Clostridia bacterium]|nr:hypothetical protein AGMMS49992_29180 [Clostridia bacterium]